MLSSTLLEVLRRTTTPSSAQRLGQAISMVPGGRRLLHRATRAGWRPAGVIFMLHRVLDDPQQSYDPELAVSTTAFRAFAAWIRAAFVPVPLAELLPRLQQKTAARLPYCALTFDDGWEDTYRLAFPILQQHQLPATVFLPVDFIGTARRFWQEVLAEQLHRLAGQADGAERLAATAAQFPWCPPLTAADLNFRRLRARLMLRASNEAEEFVAALAAPGTPPATGRTFLSWENVATMQAAGVTFGSHTLDHTLLRCASPAEAERQMRQSREQLQERLREKVNALSYPWGGLSPLTRAQAAAADYQWALTTQPAWVQPGSDPLRLPRIAISGAQLGGKPDSAMQPEMADLRLLRVRRRRAPVAPQQTAMRPLRIGFFIDNPAAWRKEANRSVGGSELQIRHQLEALPPAYFAPELYFAKAPAAGLPADMYWPAFVASQSRRRTSLWGLFRLMRRRRPDLVFSLFPDSLFRAVPAAWVARVPTIISARRNAGYWKRAHHRLVLKVVNRMISCWQVNAIPIAEMLEREEGVPANSIEILPNCLDLKRFAPATRASQAAARRQLDLPEQAWIVVSVANYREVKNLPLLVEAAARVAPTLPRALFLLVGTGPLRESLGEMITRLGVEAHVRLLGESAQIPTYLAAADVGCLTSSSEGCSNAALEYLAAGLATALSDIPANRALTPEGLFASGDPEALAGLLRQLAADPAAAAAMGRRHRRRAEQYGGMAFAERVQSHFLRAAGGVLGR
jgi:glycosyltransferase involved in cell wall biosynthesis/peptidoglycan/xylan/chitin deacetylase (PgdA/CDA1 family)